MIEQILHNIKEIESFNSTSKEEIEKFRIKFLAKKGLINYYFSDFLFGGEFVPGFPKTIN